jgi:hypothetical protein
MLLLLQMVRVPDTGKRRYFAASCIATLIAYTVPTGVALQSHEKWAELREQYPYESLENRLPTRSAGNAAQPKNEVRLQDLEKKVFLESLGRANPLRQLHEMSVNSFVNSPGFGVTRGYSPSMQQLKRSLQKSLPDRAPVQQPDYLCPFIPPSNNLISKLGFWNPDTMLSLHDDGVLDFVNTNGFGYVKDREHIAGFQKHGMTKVPAGNSNWSVAHLELVGLVVHEKPVVYMTANLPQMEEVQTAPRRPLDSFELEGLEALRGGEDLYCRGSEDKARMMGSIRAVKQCLECHGGSRGDLLGAFSYGLRRE